MKTKQVIESNLDDVRDYEWLSFNGNLIDNDEDAKLASEAWGVPVEMVNEIRNSLNFLAETIINAAKQDLIDLWNKLE